MIKTVAHLLKPGQFIHALGKRVQSISFEQDNFIAGNGLKTARAIKIEFDDGTHLIAHPQEEVQV